MFMQICPALMDWTVFLVLFAVLYGAGERGFSGLQCAWIGAVGQLAYMVASLLVGLVLTRRNARGVLLASTLGSTVMGVACLLVTSFAIQLALQALWFVFLSLFFNSFQAFMRGETTPGRLAVTVGRYTLAWSVGSAVGFLSSGSLYGLGTVALSVMTVLVGSVIFVALVRHQRRPHTLRSADEHEDTLSGSRAENARYVLVGWCLVFTAMFVQRPLQSLWPAVCARTGILPFLPGLVLSLHMLLQGVWGHRVAAFAAWRYRRTPLVVLHLSGAILLGLAWLKPVFPMSAAVIIGLGLYTGYAYFAAVYYASNSGRRSLNIGVNECLVGLGSFAGLFAAQWGERLLGSHGGMYAVCGIALLASLLIQVVLASLRPPAAAEPAALAQTLSARAD
ncbi:MAG: MFS transporter [Candidatus Anammoximicrobium sp.]|nr:MFS transporter [Candidatus Anammoximicrobium sp.]